jgi:hypothetical protein
MEMAKQINEFVDNAHDATARAAKSPAGKTAREVTERLERAAADRPTNALMRATLIGASGLAMLLSLGLAVSNRKHEALYIGQWVPTLLIVALWGQTVKR